MIFANVQNGTKGCYFTNVGMDPDELGIPYYTQKFIIGFDDLVDYLPGNRPVIKQYGKHWTVACRIKSSVTGFINPAATGVYDKNEVEVNTLISFSIEMFQDEFFETPYGDTVDIGCSQLFQYDGKSTGRPQKT